MPLPKALSPAARDLLDTLHRRAAARRPWGGSAEPEPELGALVATGELAAVPELLPLALAGPVEWLPDVRAALAGLTWPALPDLLPALDARLREGYLAPPASHNSWWDLTPASLGHLAVETDHDLLLVGLCASHPNGHVREQAVVRLAHSNPDVALPFLLLRVNDWVPAVRLRARTAVVALLLPAAAAALVRWLPLFDRLALARRVAHDDLVGQVDSVLRNPDARAALEAGLRSPDRRVRRRCYPIAVTGSETGSGDLIRAAASDPDVLVRLWACQTARRLPGGDLQRDLMMAAATDRFARVRRIGFEYWKADSGSDADRVREDFLLDPAPGLRADAQEDHRARGLTDLAGWYRAQLEAARGRRLAAAIAGLSETGRQEDADLLLRFLGHGSARVRRIALRGVNRLQPEQALPHLVDALVSGAGLVAREAARCLARRLGELDPPSLWAGASAGAGQLVRCRLLLLYRGLPKWTWLEFILRAVAASDGRLQALGITELRRWYGEFNRRQSPLPAELHQSLTILLDAVADRIPASLVGEIRFVLRQQ